MCFLALYLLRKPSALPHSLVSPAGVLLKYLGLLFVPAGVGVIANLSLIGAEWFPISVGLVGSTILSVLGTACVMRWFSSRNQHSARAKPSRINTKCTELSHENQPKIMHNVWTQITSTPLFGVTLTVLSYAIQRACRGAAVVNPVLISVLLMPAF
jgi:putative effector of murein hydrolase LrgA (UPF0299 family)